MGKSIGYSRQNINADDIEAVKRVLLSDRLTQGPEVPLFEQALCEYTGAKHAVAVSSGTMALQLVYMALEVDWLFVSANTFLATATAAVSAGLNPGNINFIDIDEPTGNISARELERWAKIHPPKAVVAITHFAGLPCDMQAILELKRKYGFTLIEDACHALGASYFADGRWWKVGEHPEVDATILSFHPTKAITTGEGGAVLVHDTELWAKVHELRDHGRLIDGRMHMLGLNGRMSDVQAALGRSQLGRLDEFIRDRRVKAGIYITALADLIDLEAQARAWQGPYCAWHLFVIKVPQRDQLRERLRKEGFECQVHYRPVPDEPWFSQASGTTTYPSAQRHGKTALSLPIYPGLSEQDQQRVIEIVRGHMTALGLASAPHVL